MWGVWFDENYSAGHLIRLFSEIPLMILFIVTCCIGITGAAAFATPAFEDNKDKEIESLKVIEGENLSLSIQIESSEEDPQVLVTLLSNSSSLESMVAQLMCNNGECSRHCWRNEDSLLFDGRNMTLILMNVTHSRAGVYKLSKPSSKQEQNKMYNLTVIGKYSEPPLSSLSPPQWTSALYYILITAGGTAVAVLLVYVAAAIFCRKANNKPVIFNPVCQDDDSATSSSSVV